MENSRLKKWILGVFAIAVIYSIGSYFYQRSYKNNYIEAKRQLLTGRHSFAYNIEAFIHPERDTEVAMKWYTVEEECEFLANQLLTRLLNDDHTERDSWHSNPSYEGKLESSQLMVSYKLYKNERDAWNQIASYLDYEPAEYVAFLVEQKAELKRIVMEDLIEGVNRKYKSRLENTVRRSREVFNEINYSTVSLESMSIVTLIDKLSEKTPLTDEMKFALKQYNFEKIYIESKTFLEDLDRFYRFSLKHVASDNDDDDLCPETLKRHRAARIDSMKSLATQKLDKQLQEAAKSYGSSIVSMVIKHETEVDDNFIELVTERLLTGGKPVCETSFIGRYRALERAALLIQNQHGREGARTIVQNVLREGCKGELKDYLCKWAEINAVDMVNQIYPNRSNKKPNNSLMQAKAESVAAQIILSAMEHDMGLIESDEVMINTGTMYKPVSIKPIIDSYSSRIGLAKKFGFEQGAKNHYLPILRKEVKRNALGVLKKGGT